MDYRIFSIKSRTLIKPASKKRRVKTANLGRGGGEGGAFNRAPGVWSGSQLDGRNKKSMN